MLIYLFFGWMSDMYYFSCLKSCALQSPEKHKCHNYLIGRTPTGGHAVLSQTCGIKSRLKRRSKSLAAASWNFALSCCFDAPLTPSEADGPHCQHVLPNTKVADIVLFQMVFALGSRDHIGHLMAFLFPGNL